MAKSAFNVQFGAVLNQAQFQAELQKLMTTVKSVKPLELKSTFASTGVDTANAEKALASLQSQGTVIGDVKVKMVEYQNTAGVVFRDIISMSGKVRDSLGNIGTSTVAVKSELAEFVGTQDEFKKMAENANEWSKRAENMGQKEKQSIQGNTSALLAKIDAMNKLAQAGDFAGANKLAAELRLENATLKENIALTKEAAIQKQSWGQRMAAAIKQTIAYTFSIGLMRTAQQELNKAIRFTIDLNTEMTKIQVLQAEGAQTPEEINALAQSFNNLAIELGATTKSVAEGSVEWLRQGKTVQETTELLRASTMLGKLGALSSAEATEYLTSTMNSYGLATEDAISVVDKLVQVDNISATSTKELATALRYSAATAKQAGVELEQLISYIAVVSSTTRQNAESIGQGMKTMFTRMQDIKAGAIDEDGLGLNNVESALARVNIQLRDTPTSFRNMSDVLEDLAAKWNTLSEVEQANLAKAIAGIRQQNLFQVMMQNMGKALEYQTEQYGALGVATDRYGIYLESIEAKQQEFKATLESLYMSADFQDLIKFFIDLGTVILKTVKGLGGLPPVLVLLATAFAVLKSKQIQKWFTDITYSAKIMGMSFVDAKTKAYSMGQGLTFAQFTLRSIKTAFFEAKVAAYATGQGLTFAQFATKGLKVSVQGLLASIPIFGWIALAVGALTEVFMALKKNADKSAEAIAELPNKISELSNNVKEISSLKKEYDELNEIEKLNEEQTKRLVEVQNELKTILPSLIGYYDEYGNFIVEDTRKIKELTAATLAQIEADKKRAEANSEKNAFEQGTDLIRAYQKMQGKEGRAERLGTLEAQAQAAEANAEYIALLDIARKNYKTMGEESQLSFIQGFTAGFPVLLEKWKKILSNEEDKITPETKIDTSLLPDYMKSGFDEKIVSAYNNINDSVKSYKENLENANKKIGEHILLTQDERDTLANYGITVKTTTDGNQSLIGTTESYSKALVDNLIKQGLIPEYLREQAEAFAENQINIEKANETIKEEIELASILSSEIDALSSATKEQSDNGYISNQTAIELINTNAELEKYLTKTADGFLFNAEAAYRDTQEKFVNMLLDWELYDAATAAAQGNLTLAASHIAAAEMADNQRVSLENLIERMNSLANSVKMPVISGGSGGGGEDPAKKAIDERIKALEKEKKALQDRIKQFKEYIDLQKESLKRAKEEADFTNDMQKKAKDLAKIKNQILILSLDDSEEARAKRLKLEEEAAELELEMAEDNEEHKYDLQMQALDDLQKAFEDGINKQIEAIEKLIEKLREQSSEMRTGGGGAISNYAEQSVSALDKVKAKLEGEVTPTLEKLIQRWLDMGFTEDQAAAKAQVYIDRLRQIKEAQDRLGRSGRDYGQGTNYANDGNDNHIAYHSGGMVESHHEGEFAGNLKTNEVFSKLLKGEYVATEGQMNNFMKNILPKMASFPTVASTNRNEQIANNIQVTFNVEGSLDKTVVPDIEDAMFKALNKALKQKGKTRNAFNYSV